MGGNSGGGTTVQKSEPWDQQKNYLTDVFQQAKSQYNSNSPSYYPGSTIADQSSATKQALGLQAQRALSGSAVGNSAQKMAADTLNGKYMNANPYLDANFNTGARQIGNSYNSIVNGNTAAMSGAGRLGSGMQAFMRNQANDTLAQNLGELSNKVYGQNYDNERANQLSMASQAPTLANMDYTNLDKLSDVGTALDQRTQAVKDADIARWNYNQNLPMAKLGQYSNLIQGNYGGTKETTTNTPTNTFGDVMNGIGATAAIAKKSDRRLKTDIQRVGTADNGLPIYLFRYIDNPEVIVMGFMADEVEQIHPEAVIEIDGYKAVYYDKAVKEKA